MVAVLSCTFAHRSRGPALRGDLDGIGAAGLLRRFAPVLTRVTALAALLLSADAVAAEVQVEGFYQMRGRLFDTLSLNRTLPGSEGLSWYVQHRLWLRPRILVSDQVVLVVDVKALDNVLWGDAPVYQGLGTVDAPPDLELLSDRLDAIGTAADGRAAVDISLWRAWAEIHTKFGTFRFGRMPLNWGLGIWQNDGLGVNADYGDSADRISWEHVIQNIWVRVAADINTEGLIHATDDTTSFNAAVGYRTERMQGGVQFQYRHRNAAGAVFNLYTVDGAFDLQFGPIGVAGEVVGQFGDGELTSGIDNVRLASAGAAVDLSLNLEKAEVHLDAGMATGDGTPGDQKMRTFTFDPDYNLGFILFEQGMPVLEEISATGERGERDTSNVLTGNGVSNALFLRPRGSYQLVRGLWADLSFLTARTAKVPDAQKELGRVGYGYEFDVGLRYQGIEHFMIMGQFGAFIPGRLFSNYDDAEVSGFSAPVFGGQLTGRVQF